MEEDGCGREWSQSKCARGGGENEKDGVRNLLRDTNYCLPRNYFENIYREYSYFVKLAFYFENI
jgi:hypothetical protein